MTVTAMISVVIPCYNAEATIGAAIESALAQDCECEVIVVNDGSTDRSAGIIAAFGGRIRAVTTENRGVSAARNTGTDMARGEYVQYLDSDDILCSGTLIARKNGLDAQLADIAFTDWQEYSCDANGTILPGRIVQANPDCLVDKAEIATATSRFWVPPAALLYRRSMVDKIGPWPVHLKVAEDARFLFEAAVKNAQFVHVAGIGAMYCLSPMGLSQGNRSRFLNACRINAEEIEQYWLRQGTLSLDRKAALTAMWAHLATASLVEGFDVFEPGRLGFNRYAHHRRLAFEAGYLVRRLIGPAGAAGIARRMLTLKGQLRSAQLPTTEAGSTPEQPS